MSNERVKMIRPDFAKWGQTAEEVRQLSITARHARTRERYQSLYMIGSGQKNATEWAKAIGRQDQTVHSWIHQYNRGGPERMTYRRTGGNGPLFCP